MVSFSGTRILDGFPKELKHQIGSFALRSHLPEKLIGLLSHLPALCSHLPALCSHLPELLRLELKVLFRLLKLLSHQVE